jgi:fibronectin-binding autotransporter adhesin
MTSLCTKNGCRLLCGQHLSSAAGALGRTRRLTFGLALATAGLLAGGLPSAQAANDAWSTLPGSANFSGTNWTTGATIPGAATGTAASTDSLYFGTSTTTALNDDDAGFSFAGLTFNSGASTYTIGGNAFTLTGAITNNGTNLQTINNAITLGANENVNAAAGAITLGGTISGAFVVSLTGQNAVTLGGTGNSFSGLTIGVGQAANSNANVALVNGVGTTVNLNSTQSVGAVLVGEGQSTLNVAAGAAITTTTFGQAAGGNERFSGLNINLGAGATVTTNSTNNIANGVISVGAQFNVLTLNGTDFAANSTNAAGGNVVAATYTASTATTLAGNANVVTDVGVTANTTINTLRFADTIGHTITIGAANYLSLNGEGAVLMSANSGAVVNTITGGALYGTSNRGYSFTNFDTTAGSGLVINSTLNNGTVSGNHLTATTSVLVAGGGSVTFGGTNNVINGALMVAGAGTNLNVGSDANLGGFNGSLSVTAATNGSPTVTLAAAPLNSGNLVVGDVLLGQTISNIVGTTVTLGGNYTGTSITTATTVGYAGGGSVNLNGGTLAATGTFALSETGTQAADTANGVVDVRNRNIGVGLNGGSIDVSSGNILTVPGVIAGSTGASPTIGALNKIDSGTLAITGAAANTNIFLNNMAGTTTLGKTGGVAATTVTVSGGLLQLAVGASVSQTTNLVVNGGTVDLNGFAGIQSSFNTLNGTGGTITNNGAGPATLYIGNGGGVYTDVLTIGSVISDGTSTLAVNNQGGATSTRVTNLTSANTYSGGTTVGAGTLNIAVNGGLGTGNVTVAAGATLTLATGVTFAHNGNTLTTLTLASTASVVNLAATTAGTVQDTVASLVIAGTTETIPGTYGSGTSGALNQFPEFIGNGVITLVPEPSTWATVLAGVCLLFLVGRRRVQAA